MALGAIGGLVSNRKRGLEDLVASLFEETPACEGACPCGCEGKGGLVSLREAWSRRPYPGLRKRLAQG